MWSGSRLTKPTEAQRARQEATAKSAANRKLEKEQKVFNYNPMGETWAEKLPCLAKLVKLQFKQEISHFFRKH